jgi:hypothetical protein
MKRFSNVVLLFVVLGFLSHALISVNSVMASPVYMTYTSVVTLESNSSGYDYGIHVGDVLTHT